MSDALDEELESRTTGRLAEPHVQVSLSSVGSLLQVNVVVAGSLVAQGIDLSFGLLSLDLSLQFRVWDDVLEVLEELLIHISDASLADQQNTLSVLPLLALGLLVGKSPQLVLWISLDFLFALFRLYFFLLITLALT